MCGIVGVAGDVTHTAKQAFKSLLFFDALRGEDGTGVIKVSKDRKVSYFKKSIPSYEYMQYNRFHEMLKGDTKALIGHNRAATKGSLIDRNAHPFYHGNIIGVHNGTLRSVADLPDHKEFEVDSDNLIYSLDKIGPKKTYKVMNGPASLVWYNDNSHLLYFIRNNDRPLCYCFTNGKKQIFFSSEEVILRLALIRHNIAIDDNKIFSVPIDTLHSVSMDKLDKHKTVSIITKELEPKKSHTQSYTNSGMTKTGKIGKTTTSGVISSKNIQGIMAGDQVNMVANVMKHNRIEGYVTNSFGLKVPSYFYTTSARLPDSILQVIRFLAAGTNVKLRGFVSYLDHKERAVSLNPAKIFFEKSVSPINLPSTNVIDLTKKRKELPVLNRSAGCLHCGVQPITPEDFEALVHFDEGLYFCNTHCEHEWVKVIK